MSKRAFKNKKNIVKTTEFYKGTSKWLIIVESPSKCSKIEYFLGTDYKCIASKGHIRSIEGLKSIDKKNNYNPLFSIIPEKSGHIDVMRKIIDLYPKDKIILASDDDREGDDLFNLQSNGWSLL
jgi:DNA topoisomerase-1